MATLGLNMLYTGIKAEGGLETSTTSLLPVILDTVPDSPVMLAVLVPKLPFALLVSMGYTPAAANHTRYMLSLILNLISKRCLTLYFLDKRFIQTRVAAPVGNKATTDTGSQTSKTESD